MLLYVEAEIRHIAILHDIVLALQAHLPLFTGSSGRTGSHQVIEADDFRTNKAPLNIGVDFAGR